MKNPVDRQLGAAKDGAVAARLPQESVDLGELLPGAGLPPLDLVVNDGHHGFLDVLRRGHRREAGLLQLLLIDARPNGAVGGQDAHGLLPGGLDCLHGLPGHVDEGDGQLSLDAVSEKVAGVAGDGQVGAAGPFQKLGVGQEMLKDLLLPAAQNAGGAVGNLGVAPDEDPQVLLIGLCLGAVDDPLMKRVGGLGTHAPQDAQDAFFV